MKKENKLGRPPVVKQGDQRITVGTTVKIKHKAKAKKIIDEAVKHLK